jgi:Flp pilus assembly protein TadG
MMRHLRRLRNERGQALALVAVLAPTLLGIGGLTVDVGHWYQVTRKAQSTADIAALQAARMVPVISGGSTSGVQSAGQDSVATNMPEASAVVTGPYCDANDHVCGQNGTPPKDVKVTVSTTVSTFLAKVLGVGDVGVTKSAVAARAERIENAAIFVASTDCKDAFTMPGSNNHFNGAIVSNGGFIVSGGDNYADGATYSTNCEPDVHHTDTNNFPVGANPVGDPVQEPWPVSYSTSDFNCDFSASSFNWSGAVTIPSGVYCATSKINLSGGSGPSGNVTLIAPQINISASNTHLTPYANGVLFFGTGPKAVQVSGSGGDWTGLIYGPNGEVQLPGALNYIGFVESQTIHISGSGVNMTANGPFVPIGYVKLIG